MAAGALSVMSTSAIVTPPPPSVNARGCLLSAMPKSDGLRQLPDHVVAPLLRALM